MTPDDRTLHTINCLRHHNCNLDDCPGHAIADALESGELVIRPGDDKRDALIEDLVATLEVARWGLHYGTQTNNTRGEWQTVKDAAKRVFVDLERARSLGYGKAGGS